METLSHRGPRIVVRKSLVKTRLLHPDGNPLPLVVESTGSDVNLVAWATAEREQIHAWLLQHGAILFRGFGLRTAEDLREFSLALVDELLPYQEARSPRTKLGDKVYSSTVYPADQHIHFHNTNSYSHKWPRHIWFACLKPSEWGGQTPLADCRNVLERISPQVRERFMSTGVMYRRNFHAGVGLPWQEVFKTTDKDDLEKQLKSSGIDFEWVNGDRLRTVQVRHAVATHPVTGSLSWFNQAHHFHISALDAETQKTLRDIHAEENLPRNAYYGDGSPILEEHIREIVDAYAAEEVAFDWQQGDAVMIDNMRVSHARRPYRGERLIALTMGNMFSPARITGGIASGEAGPTAP
jgi:alpha-ketoglutarate-dependent taurine dioxygenase